MQRFAAYNKTTREGKLQGQGVTHFGGFVWRRILTEECVVNLFFVYLGYFKQGKNYKLSVRPWYLSTAFLWVYVKN